MDDDRNLALFYDFENIALAHATLDMKNLTLAPSWIDRRKSRCSK